MYPGQHVVKAMHTYVAKSSFQVRACCACSYIVSAFNVDYIGLQLSSYTIVNHDYMSFSSIPSIPARFYFLLWQT